MSSSAFVTVSLLVLALLVTFVLSSQKMRYFSGSPKSVSPPPSLAPSVSDFVPPASTSVAPATTTTTSTADAPVLSEDAMTLAPPAPRDGSGVTPFALFLGADRRYFSGMRWNVGNSTPKASSSSSSSAVVVDYGRMYECIRRLHDRHPALPLSALLEETNGHATDDGSDVAQTLFLYGQHVQANMLKLQRALARDVPLFRLFSFCLAPGGHGSLRGERIASTEYWASRGTSPHINPLMSPLHGAVSPARTVRQALRCAEYLGIASAELRAQAQRPPFPDVVALASADALREVASNDRSGTFFGGSSDNADSAAAPPPRRVLVDLGAGHGAMLAAMCPPHPLLYCTGTDFSPALIAQGRAHFPHLDLRVGIGAPHLAASSADAVLSHGVMSMLQVDQACAHLQEMLRLLRPRSGVGLLVQLSLSNWGRIGPSFFVDDEDFFVGADAAAAAYLPRFADRMEVSPYEAAVAPRVRRSKNKGSGSRSSRRVRANRVLSRCAGYDLASFVRDIEIVADDALFPIYTPRWNRSLAGMRNVREWGGEFAVRIFRNERPFVAARVGKAAAAASAGAPAAAPPGLKTCMRDAKRWRGCVAQAEADFSRAASCRTKVKDKSSRVGGWCLTTAELAQIVRDRKLEEEKRARQTSRGRP